MRFKGPVMAIVFIALMLIEAIKGERVHPILGALFIVLFIPLFSAFAVWVKPTVIGSKSNPASS
jgi:hypothetical protein